MDQLHTPAATLEGQVDSMSGDIIESFSETSMGTSGAQFIYS
jgi:hypothetical protein